MLIQYLSIGLIFGLLVVFINLVQKVNCNKKQFESIFKISTLKVHSGTTPRTQVFRVCKGFNFQIRIEKNLIITSEKIRKKVFQLTRLKADF